MELLNIFFWWPYDFDQPHQLQISFSCPLARNIAESTQAVRRQEAGKKQVLGYQFTSLPF
jgi:hypothetical protein